MARPLAAALAVLLALPAFAQIAAKDPKEFHEAIVAAFEKGDDLGALDTAGQPEAELRLLDQAKYVQGGREPGDAKETYVAEIRSVARRLDVKTQAAVALYGERIRAPRVNGGAVDRRELDARAIITTDVKHNRAIPAAKKARMAKDMRETSARLAKGMVVDSGPGPAAALQVHAVQPENVAVDQPNYDSRGVRNWTNIPPQVQPVAFVTHEPPPATQNTGLSFLPSAVNKAVYSLKDLASHIDLVRGAEVAYEAVSGVLEEGKKKLHRCYNFVKQALIDAGVIDAPNPQSTAIIGLRPDQASMFNQDVQRHPKILDKLGYRRAKMSDLGDDPSVIPLGTIFIYGAKCGFAQYKQAGHAELSVSREEYENARRSKPKFGIGSLESDEVPACHYTCAGRKMSYLRRLGTGDNACLRMYVPVKS